MYNNEMITIIVVCSVAIVCDTTQLQLSDRVMTQSLLHVDNDIRARVQHYWQRSSR